jgi:hypothetical protein
MCASDGTEINFKHYFRNAKYRILVYLRNNNVSCVSETEKENQREKEKRNVFEIRVSSDTKYLDSWDAVRKYCRLH